jgi:hypothetical protein
MKQISKVVGLAIAAAVAAMATSHAQCAGGQHHQSGNHGRGCWVVGAQNASTNAQSDIVTVAGEILSVERAASTNRAGAGVHLRIKLDDGAALVAMLGPSWYLDNQELRLQAKDKIEITGLRVVWQGEPAIIAAQVNKGGDVLVLRDEDGFPRWAGWRRRAAEPPARQ